MIYGGSSLCGIQFTGLTQQTHLSHLLGNLLPGSHRLDERPGSHQGPLDGGGQLPGHISKGSEAVNVIRDTGEV